jgi:dTDP-4-amino-4,6-dideoxygalactose transaminase
MFSDEASRRFANSLNETYGGHATYLHSRASGLLYRFLLAFGQQGTCIVIPSASGFSLPQIVISAGYIPVFADVQSTDFNLGLTELKSAVMHAESKVTICIAIHSFGHFLDLEPIAEFCQLNNILLIEDICQLIGTDGEGKFGDLIIASFGKHKSLDGGAGGALIIRNKTYDIDLDSSFEAIDLMRLVTTDVQSNFISNYYKLREVEKSSSSRGALGSLTCSNLQYIASGSIAPDWNNVSTAAENLFLDNDIRVRNSKYLLSELSEIPEILLPTYAAKSVPWRFTFQCKDSEKRDELVNELRREVIHASNWYSSLSLDFVEYAVLSTPISNAFEKSVINLLVDKSITQEYLEKSVSVIRNFFKLKG